MTTDPLDILTPREQEIAALVARGLTNRQISLALDPPCAEETVKSHLREVFAKTGVSSRTELAAAWVRHEHQPGDKPSQANYPERGIPAAPPETEDSPHRRRAPVLPAAEVGAFIVRIPIPSFVRAHRGSAIAGVALVAALVIGAIVFRGDGGSGNALSARDLDVPQSAVAEDAGLKFDIDNAAFSGTATFVDLGLTVRDEPNPIVRVRVAPGALDARSLVLAPGSDGFGASTARHGLVRLGPASPNGAALSFTSVDATREDGMHVTIAGHWALNLVLPPDLADRLRTESLVADGPAVDQSISVSVQAAMRSTSETLVTVHVESPEAISQLGQPTLLVSGRQFTGGSIAEQENGTLITYSFPPTPFGSPATVQFGPWVKVGASEAGSLTVDLGAVIARNSLTGADRETAEIIPSDTIETSGVMQPATSLRFSTIFNSTQYPGRHWTASVTSPGALRPNGPSSFSVTGARGQKLDLAGIGVGYHKDAANVVSDPYTDVDFLIDSLDDIKGPVTITYEGQPEDTIHGDWTMSLKPAP